MQATRRQLIATSGALAAAGVCVSSAPLRGMVLPSPPSAAPLRPPMPLAGTAPLSLAAAPAVRSPVRPELLAAAQAALERGGRRFARDRIAVVDFAASSAQPRLHLVDLAGGAVRSYLVAHGSGSDPDHSGWVERFSNQPDSNASSAGAFLTGEYYVGQHGRSQRLYGLDASNSNARARAIVVHGAWYADAAMIPVHGKLGRSQGCFALGESEVGDLFTRLGSGRLIYAAKLEA